MQSYQSINISGHLSELADLINQEDCSTVSYIQNLVSVLANMNFNNVLFFDINNGLPGEGKFLVLTCIENENKEVPVNIELGFTLSLESLNFNGFDQLSYIVSKLRDKETKNIGFYSEVHDLDAEVKVFQIDE